MDNLPEANNHPPNLNKGISRRGFLRAVALGTASLVLEGSVPAASSCGNSGEQAQLGDGESKAPSLESEITWDDRGVTIWSDNSGMPIRWQDAVGNAGQFDRSEIAMAGTVITEGRARLTCAGVYRVAAEDHPWNKILKDEGELPSLERYADEIPHDIVNKEELRDRGIQIISSPSVNLSLRRGIFEEGEMLEQYMPGGGEKLDIVIVDTPRITSRSFSDGIYRAYTGIVEKHSFGSTQDLSHPHVIARSLIENISGMNEFEDYIRTAKARALLEISEDELHEWGLIGLGGYTLEKGHELGLSDRAVLMMPVPLEIPPQELSVISLKATKSAKGFQIDPEIMDVNFAEFDFNTFPRRSLQRGQSYPQEEDFPLSSSPILSNRSSAYIPKSKTPGFVLRHEMGHLWKWAHPTGNPTFDYHEGETDRLAMRSIQRAEAKYNRGDDSGYYLVLENRLKNEIIVT